MSAFTPGPWRIDDETDETAVYAGDELIARCHFAFEVEQVEPNARLIAAAPDMAKTLQLAALSLDDMERANAMLNRDVMAATCLVISNEIRNVLIKAGL